MSTMWDPDQCTQMVMTIHNGLHYNIVCVQEILMPSGEVRQVLVSRNPMNLAQSKILAILPTEDEQLAFLQAPNQIGEVVGESDPAALADIVASISVRRIARAAEVNREFMSKAILTEDLDELKDLYQTFYDMRRGGDFDAPLEDGRE